MPNPHISTQDWFYHIPAAKSKNPPSVVAPIQSQIPGLSNIPEDSITDDNDRCFRRKWIRDTDSKYVKLAKAGGRKNLLSFMPAKLSSEPVLYPRVDWFDHGQNESQEEDKNDKQKSAKDYVVLPEWYVHDEPGDDSTEVAMETNENELSNGQEAKKKPMLGYDTMTIWEREAKEATEGTSRRRSVKLPKIRKKNASKKALMEAMKLPKLKSNVTGLDDSQDMKKLLSMDYQREWLLNKSAEYTKEMKAQLVLEKERQARERRIGKRLRESLKPKKEVIEERPLFKLSRFNKVKSCVDTRWSKLESEDKSVDI